MSYSTRLSSDKLSSYLKVDCFGANQTIRYPGEKHNRPIVSRPDFFSEIYSHVINDNLYLKYGLDSDYDYKNYDKWIDTIEKATKSMVVFVEGYAGCGKSVFVQKVLSHFFPDLDYDRNYYNYDCGTIIIEGIDKSVYNGTNRIKISILYQFICQCINIYRNGQMEIIDKMEELLKQEPVLRQLDGDIYKYFTGTNAYKDAKKRLIEGDTESFFDLVFDQLKHRSTQQIIYIDCILRLAKYIIDINEPETLVICYDNLDAIEDNLELYQFDDVLIAVKENLNRYLSATQDNYIKADKADPHFIFFATFRKITAVNVGLYENAGLHEKDNKENETYTDRREKLENVCYIDGSHLFDFTDIINNRYKFLKKALPPKERCEETGKIIAQVGMAVELCKTEFAKTGFSSLWNNNIRTSSDILDFIITEYYDDANDCIRLSKDNSDLYDNRINIASGASAVLLSIIFKVQKTHSYWNEKHFDVSDLLETAPGYEQWKADPSVIHKLATLSRLIITYIGNIASYEKRPISTKEIFQMFVPVYEIDDIARALANMLKHDFNGIWRRPIVYVSDVESNMQSDKKETIDDDLETKLRAQGFYAINSQEFDDEYFTKLTICDCGESYIKKISCDYEYYSVRIGNKRSLYSAKSIAEIDNITESVYRAVSKCCDKMKLFRDCYCEKKKCIPTTYLNLMIHPRTENGKPQLHTERVIFKHIEYLDSFRHYIAHSSHDFNDENKALIRQSLLKTIHRYIDLYFNKINKIDTRRTNVAADLLRLLESVENNPNDDSTRIRSMWNAFNK